MGVDSPNPDGGVAGEPPASVGEVTKPPTGAARTKSIAVTKRFKLLFNNFAVDKHALHYALCRL